MAPTSSSFMSLGQNGFHRIAYRSWGRPDNPDVVICVPGISRTGRDFDPLAEALSDRFRVLCPDLVGRGDSGRFSQEHRKGYGVNTYVADMAALIARSGAERVDWVGTSLGGMVGMMTAAKPGAPIRRLVLNDIGPVMALPGMERIRDTVGVTMRWPDLDSAVAAMRAQSPGFGPMTDAQWRWWCEITLDREEDGGYHLRYDPNIAWAFRERPVEEARLWPTWDAITAPVLLLHGAESTLLTGETVVEMQTRGPRCEVLEIPGVGHCPALVDDHQIGAIRAFLTA